MKMRGLSRAMILMLVVSLSSMPSLAHFGWNKTKTRIPIKHPPVVAFNDTVRVTIKPAAQFDPRSNHALQQAAPVFYSRLESALTQLGKRVNPSSTQEILVTVERLDASIRDSTVQQSFPVRTGTKTSRDGKSSEPICENRMFEVPQRNWKGEANMRMQILDTKTGVSLYDGTITPSETYSAILQNRGNSECGSAIAPIPPDWPQNEDQFRQILLDMGAGEITKRIGGWTEVREALLGVCDELKPGNAKAQAGDLKGALQEWTNARRIKTDHLEPYRDYNLAVANLFLALSESDDAQVDSYLAEAQQHYNSAVQRNPSEKYFRDFPPLLADVRSVIDDNRKQIELREAALRATREEAELKTRWLGQPLDPNWFPSGEAPAQTDFRKSVRWRLESLPAGEAVAPVLQSEFDRRAARLGLSPGEGKHIVADEAARHNAVTQALHDYELVLTQVVQGRPSKRLTRDDRANLDHEIGVMNLTREMVTPIEQREGVQYSPPPPVKPTPKKSTVKPKTP